MMLRNPVEAMHSRHHQLVFDRVEAITDFELALQTEPVRGEGRLLPKECTAPQMFLYRATVRFADQGYRYLDVFDRSQIHVVLYEDFVDDPLPVLPRYLTFPGSMSQFQTEAAILPPVTGHSVRCLDIFRIRRAAFSDTNCRKACSNGCWRIFARRTSGLAMGQI